MSTRSAAPSFGWTPPLRLLRSSMARGVMLWLLTRIALWAVRFPPTITLLVSPWAAILIIVAVATLATIDARVMREPLFHASLGVPRWLAGATAAATALILEIALAVVV